MDTLELISKKLKQWAQELSTPDRPVEPYFIEVSFNDIIQPDILQFFNAVPTSFDLTDEEVDRLIAAGRELLRNDPDFQRFLAAHGGNVTEQ